MMRIFIIQVHDPVIHLEVDEEQQAITQGGLLHDHVARPRYYGVAPGVWHSGGLESDGVKG